MLTIGASSRKRHHIPFVDRLTCSVEEACAATGLGRDSIYRAINDGRLTSAKFGKRRLLSVASLLELVTHEKRRPE
jgi:excisionase family DNA binding protein